MSDNDGERELVLGNKQLLTIFFVGVLLCGVFFAMGYVVGGNSARSGIAAAGNDTAPPPVTEGKREQPQGTPTTDTTAPVSSTNDTGGQLPNSEPRLSDNPASAGSAPVNSPAAAAATPAPVASAPAPVAPAPAPLATGVVISVPEKGASYVQVTAQRRPEADDVVKALREGKYPAILAASSKPDLFEVLVGPYRSSISLAEAKGRLKANFSDLIVRRF